MEKNLNIEMLDDVVFHLIVVEVVIYKESLQTNLAL